MIAKDNDGVVKLNHELDQHQGQKTPAHKILDFLIVRPPVWKRHEDVGVNHDEKVIDIFLPVHQAWFQRLCSLKDLDEQVAQVQQNNLNARQIDHPDSDPDVDHPSQNEDNRKCHIDFVFFIYSFV